MYPTKLLPHSVTQCSLFSLGGEFENCLLFRAPSRVDHCLTSSILSRAYECRCQPLSRLYKKSPYTPSVSFPRQCRIIPQSAFASALPATFSLGNSRGARQAGVREGRRGAERGRLPLPYLTRHLALAVAAAGCDDEDDEPPPSKRILRELRRWQRRRDTHSVSFPAGRIHPPGKNCEEASTRPASASSPQCLAAVPMHLLTCLSVQGGWGRDEGCRAGWVEGEGGQGKRGGARGFRPPEALRRRSGRYRRQGAATWRSERRRRGFTTTVAPVAVAAAALGASATA